MFEVGKDFVMDIEVAGYKIGTEMACGNTMLKR